VKTYEKDFENKDIKKEKKYVSKVGKIENEI
jgi:hypothetical protein